MKIFTASQIKACDEFTIKNEPISSVFLMERAAEKCVDYLAKKIDYHQKIYLFCGNGNNGGDGLLSQDCCIICAMM
jgi:NAD(P)H-hydrate epimerase